MTSAGRQAAVPVYLVHWRRPDWCVRAVESLMASDVDVDVTVVNNSPELSANLRALLAPSVRIIETGANLGYAGGANEALIDWMASDAPYALVGAHDLQVQPDTVRLLVAAADAHPSFGLLGPRLRGKSEGSNSDDVIGDSSEPLLETEWLSGTAILLSRPCISQIGGFDESLGSYVEDLDLCLRATAASWGVGLVPAALADGLGQADSRAAVRARSNLVLVIRRHRGRRRAAAVWVRTVREVVRACAGSLAFWRQPESRSNSRRRAADLASSLTALRYVLRGLPPPESRPAPTRGGGGTRRAVGRG